MTRELDGLMPTFAAPGALLFTILLMLAGTTNANAALVTFGDARWRAFSTVCAEDIQAPGEGGITHDCGTVDILVEGNVVLRHASSKYGLATYSSLGSTFVDISTADMFVYSALFSQTATAVVHDYWSAAAAAGSLGEFFVQFEVHENVEFNLFWDGPNLGLSEDISMWGPNRLLKKRLFRTRNRSPHLRIDPTLRVG